MLWVARRKAHNGRGDIRAGNEPKQVSWSYFLTQERGRVCCQNPLALPIEATEVLLGRGQTRTRDRRFSHSVPVQGWGVSPAEPPAWHLLSEPWVLHTQLLWKSGDPAGLRRVRGVTLETRPLSCLGGHFAPQIILGHHVCFQGLSNPSNVHFKDGQGRGCRAFGGISVKSHSPSRGAPSAPRHPCYGNDTPVTLLTPTVAVNSSSTLTFSSCTVTHGCPWCSV